MCDFFTSTWDCKRDGGAKAAIWSAKDYITVYPFSDMPCLANEKDNGSTPYVLDSRTFFHVSCELF